MKKINPKEYQKYVDQKAPKPAVLKNCIWAFIVGGLICTLGQVITNVVMANGLNKEEAATATAILLVLLSALLTGVGIYDKIVKKGGAGAIVPITGFANAIVSPAMEYKREGFVLGVGAKMFTVAGPVLVYGFGSAVLVGLIYLLFK